jgi:hypothetical protein
VSLKVDILHGTRLGGSPKPIAIELGDFGAVS